MTDSSQSIKMAELEHNFQIMSDLHLETPKSRPTYEECEIVPRCSCLALLGDIGHASDPRLFDFLDRQLAKFQLVLYLLGNHEPYGTTFPEAAERVKTYELSVKQRRNDEEAPRTGHFVFLKRTRYDVSSQLTVLGCTLFSSITPKQTDSVTQFVSDFSYINEWTVASHNAAHQTDVQWLNTQVREMAQKEPNRTIVVFTHHSPTSLEAADDPQYIKDDGHVRSAFNTDLSSQSCWTSSQVKLWAFGHTHFNCDIKDPQTGKRIFANQKGYSKSEALNFSPDRVVAMPTRHEIEEFRDDEPDLRQRRCPGCVVS